MTTASRSKVVEYRWFAAEEGGRRVMHLHGPDQYNRDPLCGAEAEEVERTPWDHERKCVACLRMMLLSAETAV